MEKYKHIKNTKCCVCNKELSSMRRKFCSESCSTYYEMKRRESLNIRSLFGIKKCKYCGKEYQPKSERHVYCSKSCCDVVLSERRRKKRERHRKLGISSTVWNRQTKGFNGTSGSGNKYRKTGQYGHMIELCIPMVEVNTASFTPSDTEERIELRSKVEEYLANGGVISKYGAQPAVIQEENAGTWEVSEEEEKSAVDDYREVAVYNGY